MVWLASRVFTTAVMLVLSALQGATKHTQAGEGFLLFSNHWDAGWYRTIAEHGYPNRLPLDASGNVDQNAWAFMPVFPYLVRLLGFIGIDWWVGAIMISLAAGLGASLVLYRLLIRFLPARQALFAVVLFCVAPASPLLQVGYAEALGFLMLATALLLLVRRKYLPLFPLVLVWAFTRPGVVAFALALAIVLVVRWLRRATEPLHGREIAKVVTLGLFTAAVGLAWPVVAWIGTGVPTAYFQTELRWRASSVGHDRFIPGSPWFEGGVFWAKVLHLPPWLGVLCVVVVVVAFVWWMFRPSVRRLGLEIRAWVVSYALYLFAVLFPQSSVIRMLAPLFPLAGALAATQKRAYRVSLVVGSLILQIVWLIVCWYVTDGDFTPA